MFRNYISLFVFVSVLFSALISQAETSGVYRIGGPAYGTVTCRGTLSPRLQEPRLVERPTETVESLEKFAELLNTLVNNANLRKEAKQQPEVLQPYYANRYISATRVIGIMVDLLDYNYKALTTEAIEEGYKAFQSYDEIRMQSLGASTRLRDLNEFEVLARAVTTFNYRVYPFDKESSEQSAREAINLVNSIPRNKRLHPGFNWHLAEFHYYLKDYETAQGYLIEALKGSLMRQYSPDGIPSQTLITALEEVAQKSGVELSEGIRSTINTHKKTGSYVFFDDTMWGPYLIGFNGEDY